MQRINRPGWRVVSTVFLLLIIAALAIPAVADPEPDIEPAPEPVVVDPSIQAVWDMTDGQIASDALNSAWIFGPEPIAAAYEYYPQSPTDFRKLVYYDKGRLELGNPHAPPGSIWMVSGGLLVAELLSGRIQLGETEFVSREPADIPLVGDLEQPAAVTYETLARHSSINPVADGERTPQRVDSARYIEQLGKQVTELLNPDGSITPGAVTDHDVTIVEYEELLGHNVASPFSGWASGLPMPALNLLGLPVTEPYWIDTQIDGIQTRVLIQAFERRTLTYTPTNPEGWQVESGNVGLHYRLWRGLERPDRPELAQLAAEIPFGEEVLTAARDHYIDPYIFVAISLNSTGGDPFAPAPNGGHGLLGAQDDEEDDEVNLNDPGLNADIAARQFAAHMYSAWDWPTILRSFFLDGETAEDGPTVEDWIGAVLATVERLEAHYPPTGPRVDPVRDHGRFIGEGRAAYYSESYDVAWWQHAMSLHASWGNAVDEWQADPNGFYCVHPDYLVGESLKLEANGRVLECTIGDRVAVPHQIAWRSRWSVELSWPTFLALGLDRNNLVRVSYLGEREIAPTPTPEPSATADPSQTEELAPAPGGETPLPGRPDGQVPPPAPPQETPEVETPQPTEPEPSSTETPDMASPEEPPAEATPTAEAAEATPTATQE